MTPEQLSKWVVELNGPMPEDELSPTASSSQVVDQHKAEFAALMKGTS